MLKNTEMVRAKFSITTYTEERRLSGLRLSGLSNYPDQSHELLCFFYGIFQKFSCKILSFFADSLKEIEKMLLFLFKNTVLKN